MSTPESENVSRLLLRSNTNASAAKFKPFIVAKVTYSSKYEKQQVVSRIQGLATCFSKSMKFTE